MKTATTSKSARLGWLWSLVVAVCFATVGCVGGYSFTGASIPPEAKTITVGTFPNYASTVNPQLSQKLSDGLRNMFASQTSLTVSGADDEGDLSVTGEITAYETRASALSSSDQVSMNRLSVTIKVKFVNRIDPKADFNQAFTRYKDYNAQLDFSAVENSLVEQIVEELCEDVFNKSVVNW
ncbi:MAG: LptE family protein [Bacteroidales bacterium]|nr:LptE family protein [Bacteroidales bacterium]